MLCFNPGRITLKMCQKYKKRKEEADELAELDRSNIITSGQLCAAPGGRGGTLGISGWGCAARTLEPLAYTRASFRWILLPYTRVYSPNHRFPSEFRFLTVNNIQ